MPHVTLTEAGQHQDHLHDLAIQAQGGDEDSRQKWKKLIAKDLDLSETLDALGVDKKTEAFLQQALQHQQGEP